MGSLCKCKAVYSSAKYYPHTFLAACLNPSCYYAVHIEYLSFPFLSHIKGHSDLLRSIRELVLLWFVVLLLTFLISKLMAYSSLILQVLIMPEPLRLCP